jgi:hypothetical protein
MSEELHDEAAAQDTMAVAGKPASQVEAENPPGDVLEQEAREYESRVPAGMYVRDEADEMAETDAEAAAPDQPADQAPPGDAPQEA